MEHLRERWDLLSHRFADTHKGVAPGKMMSADALTYGGKVFAFFTTKGGRVGLGCRVGRDYPIDALSISDWQHLAPFKTKPPMKDWIVVGEGDLDAWERVMDAAYEVATGRT